MERFDATDRVPEFYQASNLSSRECKLWASKDFQGSLGRTGRPADSAKFVRFLFILDIDRKDFSFAAISNGKIFNGQTA